VHHDPLLADGTALIDLSADALAARGVWTLPEVLARLPEGLGVDLEVKNLPGEPDYDETQRVVDLLTIALQPAVGRRPLMASSFNPLTVQRLGAALDSVPTGLLHGPGLRITAAAALARELGATVLCPHVEALPPDAETIGAVHDAGLAVMVWVVDDPNEAIQFAHAGVDALCTNEPGRLVKALRMS
jgi:glycerophosphoryl diester phosphodiesterase